jgi:hypothetical protein
MSDPDENEEPLQSLAPGTARRHAKYRPATPGEHPPPPTNVGGYDDLLEYCRLKGLSLARSRQGLVVIDSLIESAEKSASLAALVRPAKARKTRGANSSTKLLQKGHEPVSPSGRPTRGVSPDGRGPQTGPAGCCSH